MLHSKATEELAEEPYLPDPRNPNGFCRFKTGEDVVVAFHGDSPVWYWRRNGGPWELHMMRVTRESDLEDTADIDALLAELENYEEEEDDTDFLADLVRTGSLLEDIESMVESDDDESEIPDVGAWYGNDPERLTPDALLGVLKHFTQVLKDAHNRLDRAPSLPDPTDPNSERRFRSNGELIVAYQASEGAKQRRDWCWRKKKDGRWKLYRLRICAGMEIPDAPFEYRLQDGDWD